MVQQEELLTEILFHIKELKDSSQRFQKGLDDKLEVALTDNKSLQERVESLKKSEDQLNSSLSKFKTQSFETKARDEALIKELRENNQQLNKDLQETRNNLQISLLRADQLEQWKKRDIAQLEEVIVDKTKLIESMITKERHNRDLEKLKIQHQIEMDDLKRDIESQHTRLAADRKKLEDELARAIEQFKKAQHDGAQAEVRHRELQRVTAAERDRASRELADCRARELESVRREVKARVDAERGRWESKLASMTEAVRLAEAQRDEFEQQIEIQKRDNDSAQLDQQRKHKLEILRLQHENEGLKTQLVDRRRHLASSSANLAASAATTSHAAPAGGGAVDGPPGSARGQSRHHHQRKQTIEPKPLHDAAAAAAATAAGGGATSTPSSPDAFASAAARDDGFGSGSDVTLTPPMAAGGTSARLSPATPPPLATAEAAAAGGWMVSATAAACAGQAANGSALARVRAQRRARQPTVSPPPTTPSPPLSK